MAWFKRKRDEAPAEETADAVAPAPWPASGAGGGGGEPAVDTPPAAPEPAASASSGGEAVAAVPAWTTAPPMASVIPTIQRSLGRIEARSATTLGRPAPLSLAPLGHALTPDAPAGVIGTLAVDHEAHEHGPASHDQPPLDYVQRAPAGAVPPRPAAPAQLLVPSFQPNHLPRVPVAAPAVQRAAATPSFTTAPDPTPPLVLPVGEVLSPPPAEATAVAPPAPPGDAPLLAGPGAPPVEAPAPTGPGVQRAPAVELPLAPVQRHADHPDHPGHVVGDEAPTEPAAEVQRAPLDVPAPMSPDAPLLSASPLLPAHPPAEAPVPGPDTPGGTATPAADLPLAPVQRHADHPGHVDGDEAPTEAEVQRAALDDPAPAAPVPSAPLIGDSPPLAAGPPPEPAPGATSDAPSAPSPPAPDLPLPGSPPVQRSAAPGRPVGLGAPIPAVPPTAGPPEAVQRAPLPAPPSAPAPTAPLVGDGPRPAAPALPLASVQRAPADDDAADEDGAATASEGPALDMAQRAPLESPSPAPDVTAPLLGQSPIEPTIDAQPVAATAPGPEAGATASLAGAAGAAPGPELELVQRAPLASAGSSTPTSAATTAPTSSSAATPVAAPLPPLVVAPLLGGRPFATQVQRAAQGATAPAGLVDRSSPEALSPEPGRVYQPLASIGMWNGAPPPDLPGPAVEAPPAHIASAVQRATGTDVSNTRIRRDTGPAVQRLSARAFTSEGEVHIPTSVGSLASGEGASLATHELVHVGQQSALGSSRPHEHTPEGQHLEAQARSAEHASLAGLDLPTLPLAAPAAPTVQRAPSESGSSPFSPQQLDTLMHLANNPPSGEASVQRELMDAPPRPSTPAPALPGEPDLPGAASAPQPQTPQELEELATKLFPTLRNLFRSELLGFRRRSGTSSDRPLI